MFCGRGVGGVRNSVKMLPDQLLWDYLHNFYKTIVVYCLNIRTSHFNNSYCIALIIAFYALRQYSLNILDQGLISIFRHGRRERKSGGGSCPPPLHSNIPTIFVNFSNNETMGWTVAPPSYTLSAIFINHKYPAPPGLEAGYAYVFRLIHITLSKSIEIYYQHMYIKIYIYSNRTKVFEILTISHHN